jgi:hypothetical protein
MNVKSSFILLCLVLILTNVHLWAEKVTAIPRKVGTIYHMNGDTGDLIVAEGEIDSDETVRILFNHKDYTPYVRELLACQPIAYASGTMLILGKRGTILFPGETEILIVTASGIGFEEGQPILHATDVSIEMIELKNHQK